METRRTRRNRHRHLRRIALVIAAVGVLGVGLALPRSTTVSLVVLALAVASLAAVRFRAVTPTPGPHLKQRIQASSASAASAALEWFQSRTVPVPLDRSSEYDGGLLPARYEAIATLPQPLERRPQWTGQQRLRGGREHRSERRLRETWDWVCEKLNNTTHLWVLIAIVYAFLAFFALVLALTFIAH
jgi:hypothetical protein